MDPEQDKSEWFARWEAGRIGFHSEAVNPHLRHHWPTLGLCESARVLVPLAGKSRDILWLAEAGHRVIANELSPLAVSAFFEEAGLEPERRREAGFVVWTAGPVRIYCGDFFALSPDIVGPVDACYDRAALVALPGPLRGRYVERLAALLAPGVPVLLISVDYDQRRMDGPPYSVPEAEVRRLASGRFDVAIVASANDMLAENPRFAERGLERMEETVYRLTRRADTVG